MNAKTISIAIAVALIAGFGGLLVGGRLADAPSVGGSTSADWSANSFEILGTTVINSSRALVNLTGLTTSSGNATLGTTTVEAFTQGGSVYSTTTTAAAHTFTEAELLNNSVLRFLGSATAAAMTATLPATSTMTTLLPNPGDSRTWFIENGYTAAATTTTIAAGTGIDLQEPDGQNVVIGINNYAKLTCFREVSTDVVCMVDETIPAD